MQYAIYNCEILIEVSITFECECIFNVCTMYMKCVNTVTGGGTEMECISYEFKEIDVGVSVIYRNGFQFIKFERFLFSYWNRNTRRINIEVQ